MMTPRRTTKSTEGHEADAVNDGEVGAHWTDFSDGSQRMPIRFSSHHSLKVDVFAIHIRSGRVILLRSEINPSKFLISTNARRPWAVRACRARTASRASLSRHHRPAMPPMKPSSGQVGHEGE